MANTHTTLTELFTDIADAIKEKNGKTEPIVADTFPVEIESLKTGFDYINSDIKNLPDYAFCGCEDLLSVDCYNLESIGASAFENCTRLKSVVLYDSVVSVGENAFKGCNCTIYCEVGEKPDAWSDNWNSDSCNVVWGFAPVKTWDISATENDNVVAKLYNDVDNDHRYKLIISGNGKMKDFSEQIGSLNCDIPWIRNYFYYYIVKVNISTSVTNIGNYAFNCCTSLTSVNIPNSVTSIGDSVFYECTSLESVTIPNNVTSIGNSVFNKCTSLTSVNIPNSVTSIGGTAFIYCTSLKSITIPDSVTNIGYTVFGWCSSLTSITFEGTVAQWNTIIFGNNWNSNTGDYTIHCTDGTITKDGTITYY